jgi:hypothetical protein
MISHGAWIEAHNGVLVNLDHYHTIRRTPTHAYTEPEQVEIIAVRSAVNSDGPFGGVEVVLWRGLASHAAGALRDVARIAGTQRFPDSEPF